PSIQPSLFNSCRNASTRTAMPEALLPSRKPMRKTFPVCCASANEAVDNRAAITRQIIIFVFIVSTSRLSNHLIGSRQHIGWNRYADLFRCFQIDDELKVHRLLYG